MEVVVYSKIFVLDHMIPSFGLLVEVLLASQLQNCPNFVQNYWTY